MPVVNFATSEYITPSIGRTSTCDIFFTACGPRVESSIAGFAGPVRPLLSTFESSRNEIIRSGDRCGLYSPNAAWLNVPGVHPRCLSPFVSITGPESRLMDTTITGGFPAHSARPHSGYTIHND